MTIKRPLLFTEKQPDQKTKNAFFLAGLFSFAALLFFIFVILLGYGYISGLNIKDFAYFIIFIPIAEEIIFRGFLQKYISRKVSGQTLGITFGNILTSLIFAGLHRVFYQSISATLVFFPSLLLGFLYDKSGSIKPSIITHAAFNLNVFIIYRSDILYIFL